MNIMNECNKKRIVVVGGGTAGAIASTYIKSYWGEHVEVVVIYDHKVPNIGIGESLTPTIYNYLNYVGITTEELIKNTNSTIKLGISFKNWHNDGTEFYHPFIVNEVAGIYADNYNFLAAYDIVLKDYDFDVCYGKSMFDNCVIPSTDNFTHALHIDGVLFSKYVLNKFEDKLTIIDGVVESVVKKTHKEEIDYLVLENGQKIDADFFIDATGFSASIFKNLENEWIDKQDVLPLDSCIPNPVFHEMEKIPVHTTAEASEQGWILQVPLSNRWGCGYLFSSKFCSDDEARDNFSKFLKERFNVEPSNQKILKFKSGYWKKQWNGNCLAIGLSSGFAEPLEATNIHQAVMQIEQFTDVYNFNTIEFDEIHYNRLMQEFYERVYIFIGFCYTTNRTDSEFWRYMTNSVPDTVRMMEEKIKKDFLNGSSMSLSIFNYDNFTKIAHGLKKIDTNSYRKILQQRSMFNDDIKRISDAVKQIKNDMYISSKDHAEYIKGVILK